MLQYAIVFLIIALVAGLLGLWALVGVAAGIAKVLCILFLVMMLASLFRGGGRAPRV